MRIKARWRWWTGAGGALLLAAFVALAVLVSDPDGPVGRADGSWHASVHAFAHAHPAFRSAMRGVTHIGDTITLVLVNLLLLAVCLLRRRWRLAVFVTVVALVGWGLRLAVRQLVGRPRPEDAVWPAEGFSFPSGHTTNTTLTVGLLLIAGWPWLRPPARAAVSVVAVLVVAAVGFSRIVGGVHWPTDVLGGLLLGGGVLCVAVAAYPPSRLRPLT